MKLFEGFGNPGQDSALDNETKSDPRRTKIEDLTEDPRACIEPEETVLKNGNFLSINETSDNIKEVDTAKVERAREFIKNKIVENHKISLENYKEFAENILQEIEKSPILFYEGVEEEIAFYIDIKVSALSGEVRESDMNNPDKEKNNTEMNMRNAQWMDDISQFVLKNRDNPELIENFWRRFEAIFSASTFLDKRTGDTLKYGILAQMAAMDLVENLEKSAQIATKKKISVSIEYSTPEEDVLEQVDFWAIVECDGRRKEIPCQVKSLDVKNDTKRKMDYLSNNIINFCYPENNKKFAFEYPGEKKQEQFFKRNREQRRDAIFIILPRYGKQLIKNDGTVKEDVEKSFTNKAVTSRGFASVFDV